VTDLRDVPTTVVTGFLGAGKTTAILDLFQHRPPDERWAVLVNEFGRMGIDGAVFTNGGVAVKEVAGGCICCTAGVDLRVGLVRLLRDVRPQRLLIEPSGLAHPAGVVDALRSPGIREAVAPRATIALVDPRRASDVRFTSQDTWGAQLAIADVLVANFCDVATPAQVQAFRDQAGALWPPKLEIATTTDGRLDPRWLDLDPSPRAAEVHEHIHTNAEGRSFVFPPSAVFERERLEPAIHGLVRPNSALPGGVLRLKAVFRTPSAWLLVNATPDQVRWSPVDHRRDSRIEIVATADPALDWEAVEARIRAALRAIPPGAP
jgi:G3E family GTPase